MKNYTFCKLHTNLNKKTWVTTIKTLPLHFEIFGGMSAESPEEAVEMWARKIRPDAKNVKVNLIPVENLDNTWEYTFEVED